jgi:hypothetical protein
VVSGLRIAICGQPNREGRETHAELKTEGSLKSWRNAGISLAGALKAG